MHRRQVLRSPLLTCASAAAATQLVALLRRLGSWQARAEPPRVLVVINPRSGQGRCAPCRRPRIAARAHAGVVVQKGLPGLSAGALLASVASVAAGGPFERKTGAGAVREDS